MAPKNAPNSSNSPAVLRRSGGPSVGQVFVERVSQLLAILGSEPKHSALDQAYLAAKEALERISGVPARHSGQYTKDGEPLVFPAQGEADPNASWERDPIAAVPVSKLDGNVAAAEVGSASGQQSAASGDGNSGAPPVQTV